MKRQTRPRPATTPTQPRRALIILTALLLLMLAAPVVVVVLYIATHHNPDPRQADRPAVVPWWAEL